MAFDLDKFNNYFTAMKNKYADTSLNFTPQTPISSPLTSTDTQINPLDILQKKIMASANKYNVPETGIDKFTTALSSPLNQGLLHAGLSMMATPPRPEPYTDLEVLGRGGLTGLGAMTNAQNIQTTEEQKLLTQLLAYQKERDAVQHQQTMEQLGLGTLGQRTRANDIKAGGAGIAPIKPGNYTPESLATYERTRNRSDLVPVVDQTKTETPEQLARRALTEETAAKGIVNYMPTAAEITERIKKDKADTGTTADLRYQNLIKRQTLGDTLTPEELADIKAYEKRKTLGTTTGATLRFEGLKDIYNDIRNVPVYNNDTGQLEFASNRELNEGKATNKYAPAGPQMGVMKQQNLIQDITGQVARTKEAVTGLKNNFTSSQVAQLALVMESRDPASAWSNFMGSSFAKTLSPDQQTFVVRILQLKEQAMAMRSVLGAGQGSDLLRLAIEKTLPGTLNVSKSFAMEQLNEFESTLQRLQRYIPKARQVPGTVGSEGGGNAPQATHKYIPGQGIVEIK